MQQVSYEDGTVIANQVEEALSFAARTRGLLGRSKLEANQGMLFRGCSSIHMFGMLISLDVVFLDHEDRVVKVVRQLKPWQIAAGGHGAKHVIELAAGVLPADRPVIGERLVITDSESSADQP